MLQEYLNNNFIFLIMKMKLAATALIAMFQMASVATQGI